MQNFHKESSDSLSSPGNLNLFPCTIEEQYEKTRLISNQRNKKVQGIVLELSSWLFHFKFPLIIRPFLFFLVHDLKTVLGKIFFASFVHMQFRLHPLWHWREKRLTRGNLPPQTLSMCSNIRSLPSYMMGLVFCLYLGTDHGLFHLIPCSNISKSFFFVKSLLLNPAHTLWMLNKILIFSIHFVSNYFRK